MPVPYVTHLKALEVACYFHNRCRDMEEILEMFLHDAEDAQKLLECMKEPA
jgi:hypothetical protein